MKKFLIIFIEGFANTKRGETQKANLRDFCHDMGYEPEDISKVKALEVGQSCTLTDGISTLQTVVRIN